MSFRDDHPDLNIDQVVEITLAAEHEDVKTVAERYQISDRTVRDYKRHCRNYPECAQRYLAAQLQANRTSIARKRVKQEEALNKLLSAVNEGKDAKLIDALAKAYATVSDTMLAECIAMGLTSRSGESPEVPHDNVRKTQSPYGRQNKQVSAARDHDRESPEEVPDLRVVSGPRTAK